MKAGHFIVYLGHAKHEGDKREEKLKEAVLWKQNDLFTLIQHQSGRDELEVVLDPSKASNIGRYVSGVSPDRLSDANSMAFVVEVDGVYHLIIVAFRDCKAGEALQYHYGGLDDESKSYIKLPDVTPPTTM